MNGGRVYKTLYPEKNLECESRKKKNNKVSVSVRYWASNHLLIILAQGKSFLCVVLEADKVPPVPGKYLVQSIYQS